MTANEHCFDTLSTYLSALLGSFLTHKDRLILSRWWATVSPYLMGFCRWMGNLWSLLWDMVKPSPVHCNCETCQGWMTEQRLMESLDHEAQLHQRIAELETQLDQMIETHRPIYLPQDWTYEVESLVVEHDPAQYQEMVGVTDYSHGMELWLTNHPTEAESTIIGSTWIHDDGEYPDGTPHTEEMDHNNVQAPTEDELVLTGEPPLLGVPAVNQPTPQDTACVPTDLEACTRDELRKVCRQVGVTLSGRKIDMIHRIKRHLGLPSTNGGRSTN